MPKIKSIKTRKILDSRGFSTVEAELETEEGIFFASAPSGASKGKYEAVSLSSKEALKNIKEVITSELIGKDIVNQKQLDEILIALDGTKNKSRLGANATLVVSMAGCRALSASNNLSLHQYISEISEMGPQTIERMPRPCFLVAEGGRHASNNLDIQEFMVVPQEDSFSENLKTCSRVYRSLREILKKNFGKIAINLGYEGGFAPPLKKTKEVLDFIMEAIKEAGYEGKIKIGLDCAASEFYQEGEYKFEGKKISPEELLDFYRALIKDYPIVFLEDPFSQDDRAGWRAINLKIKSERLKVLIVGDDLTVTNPERIKMAQEKMFCDGVIIKPNQIGTVSETIEAVKLAKLLGWKIIVSHRSGETNDDFIADFAVGVGADFVKFGSLAKKERAVKYDRLLEIEAILK